MKDNKNKVWRLWPFLLVQVCYLAMASTLNAQTWIVFDPGHGGSQAGSVTPITGYYEKNVNLDVALLLKEILDFHGFTEGVHYVFTRVTDTTIPNDERAYIANNANSERFVSIHHNSADPCPATQYSVTLYSTLPACDGAGNPWFGTDR